MRGKMYTDELLSPQDTIDNSIQIILKNEKKKKKKNPPNQFGIKFLQPTHYAVTQMSIHL
jgi:hypothetical protein